MLIEIKDLYKIYNEGKESEVRALDGVTLHIDRGEFVAIVGQSGSGKSTLMNVLGCLDIPTYGEYHLNGTDVTSLSDKQLAHIRNREIGFIFQGYNLIQELDALENVTLPLIYQGVSVWDREDIAMEALEKVGMAERAHHRPSEMSGGQQQRVAIARAIATHPPIIMLGIIIGVASVVIMVSVVQGQNRQTMEMFEKLGDNKITVQAYGYYDTNNETSQKLYDYCLTMSDLVEGITPDVEINETATVQYGAKTIRINDWNNGNYDWQTAMHIKLGSDQYGVCNNYTLAGGREMSYLDVEKTNAVCVLGAGAKEALFDFTDPVGEYITINGQPFKVVGYYEAVDLEGWNELDNIIVLPYTFNRSMNNNYNIDSYVVKAKSAQATVEAMTKLDAFLNGLFPMNADGNRDNGSFYVNSNNSSAEQVQSQSNMQSLVLGAIAGISLLVGGIGIMNIMLVTVTERTREIGIRKAIGAERKSIIAQFLIEAAMICSIGCLIGIAIGYVGTMVAGKLLLSTTTDVLLPSPIITLGAFLFSVALGVIFGMYPAVKASGLQPVVALRAE